jgi:SOS-response transcriptional repressor LexA
MSGLIAVNLFEFIISYKESHDGNSPTYREMVDGIGVSSTNTIFQYIRKMEKHGLIKMVDGKMCLAEGSWNYDPLANKGESMYVKSHATATED